MRLLLPLLCLAAAACGAFGGIDTHASDDHPDTSTGGDSGVLAEARIPGPDAAPADPDPCTQNHFYCNDFEQQSLRSHLSGSPVVEPPDGGVPDAVLVPRETGGQAGKFSLAQLPADERAKNWIGHFLKDAPAGALHVSLDVKIAPAGDWPVNADLPYFVISLPSTVPNDSGTAMLSGLVTLGIDGSGKSTLYRNFDDGSGGQSLTPKPNTSSAISLGKWFHVDMQIDDKVTATITRADGSSSTISASHGIATSGNSPSLIFGPAHYVGQAIPAVDVLYDNVVVDIQ